MSFSGETDYAYPLLLHAMSTIDSWRESADRRMSLETLRGHLTRVMNSVLLSIDFSGLSTPKPPGDPTYLLLGGYSWKSQKWVMWSLKWDVAEQEFIHSTLRSREANQRGAIMWTGERAAVGEAKKRLNALMRSKKRTVSEDGFNMEPLEVVRDIIRDKTFSSVGGPPQVGKVYRHLNNSIFTVLWSMDGKSLPVPTLLGRELLSYEENIRWAEIDPDKPGGY